MTFGLFSSAEHLRSWAYDADAMLIDQDEDLVVYAIQALPLLLECASDQLCPKSNYILDCVDANLAGLAMNGDEHSLAELEEAIANISDSRIAEKKGWIDVLSRRLSYRRSLATVDKEKALQIGCDLLLHRGVLGMVGIVEEGDDFFMVRRTNKSYWRQIKIGRNGGAIAAAGWSMNGQYYDR